MQIDIVSLFPECIEPLLRTSVVGRAGSHHQLGRSSVPDDDAVMLDALRPPDLDLDQAPTHLHEAHEYTLGVAPDSNVA